MVLLSKRIDIRKWMSERGGISIDGSFLLLLVCLCVVPMSNYHYHNKHRRRKIIIIRRWWWLDIVNVFFCFVFSGFDCGSRKKNESPHTKNTHLDHHHHHDELMNCGIKLTRDHSFKLLIMFFFLKQEKKDTKKIKIEFQFKEHLPPCKHTHTYGIMMAKLLIVFFEIQFQFFCFCLNFFLLFLVKIC